MEEKNDLHNQVKAKVNDEIENERREILWGRLDDANIPIETDWQKQGD